MVPARTHYPGLDVLRGIAVVLVVIYHYSPFFRIGWIGVDLFFVLSGFLITDILLRTREQKGYFKNFYMRRVLRIFPLYYLVLLAFFIIAPYAFSDKGPLSTYRYYVDYQAYFWTFTQNWLFISKGMPTEPYLNHFWSLAIEEQFYLFWPLLVFLVKSLDTLKAILIIFFLLALGLRLYFYATGLSQIETYYCNLFTRLDALSAGGLLAVWLAQGKRVSNYFHLLSFTLFSTLVLYNTKVSGLNNDSLSSRTLGYSVYALFFTSCCFLMLNSKYVITRVAFLAFLGRISYGVYVYHLPVLLLIHYFFAGKIYSAWGHNGYTQMALALCAAGITLLTSILSFYTIEMRFLNLRKKFS